MAGLPKVELAGSRKAMGECFGEQFREGIQNFAQSRMDHLVAFVQRHDPERNLSRDGVLELARSTIEAHQQFEPAIWEEFQGIARAADLTVEELLIENGYTDFRDFVLFGNDKFKGTVPDHLGECSAFLAPAERIGAHPIVGQTWDMNADAAEFCMIVHRRPDDAPETLGLTSAGCLCLIGMNSEGVSVANTNLVPTDPQVGVNYLFTITRALQASSAEEAAGLVESAPRLSGHNYYMADDQTAIDVETTAAKSHRTVVEDDVFVHTNHYLSDSLKPLEFSGQDPRNSTWRREHLNANFKSLGGSITMDDCWEQMSDITQDHTRAAIDWTGPAGSATLATVVQCPGTRTLYICRGGAEPGNAEALML